MKRLYAFTQKSLGIARCLAIGGLMLTALASMAESHLVIYFADGTATSFVVSDKPHVSFGDSDILVRSNDLTTSYPLATVKKFAFADQSDVVAPTLMPEEVRFTYTDANLLTACGLKAGQQVTLHTTTGQPALTATASADGTCSIDLSSLPAGIYIVKTSSKSFKIKH